MKLYQNIKNRLNHNMPLTVIVGKKLLKLGNLELVWWGLSQSYKWRWNITHIDLGVISIYGLKSPLWNILAFLIKPLRNNYDKKTKEN